MTLKSLFLTKKPIIGMIHLPALPGYAKHPRMKKVIDFALKELATLENNGVQGVLIENEGDRPHSVTASPEVISSMTAVCCAVVAKAQIPVGVEVLLNDPKASLAIAVASNCNFIRTDYFVDRMSRPNHGGEMYINPSELMEYKKKVCANNIAIIADLQVKYATLLEKNKSISRSVHQAKEAGADIALISGTITGEAPNLAELIEAKHAAKNFPIMIGSGFSHKNAQEFLRYADGAIVGTSLKSNGKISAKKTRDLMRIVDTYDKT